MGTRILRGPLKALVVVCLVIGVFTMHGLTGSHDAGMADAPAAASQVMAPEVSVQAGHDGHLHSLGEVCLAMLAALLLGIVVALALRSRALAHPVVPARTANRVAVEEPLPPWRRPTLSKLCVLRT